jgi:hypothetical protein
VGHLFRSACCVFDRDGPAVKVSTKVYRAGGKGRDDGIEVAKMGVYGKIRNVLLGEAEPPVVVANDHSRRGQAL